MIILKKHRKKRILICATKFRTVALSLCLVLAFLVGSIAITDSGASEVFLKTKRKLPIYGVQTEQKLVALSFDAAYGSDKTEKIMEILKSYGANATFFLVGFWVDKYPEMTKSIFDNGFEIGTHSNEHAHMSKLSASDIQNDLSVSMSKIQAVTGKSPTIFRPPYGEYNDTLLIEAQKLGLTTIQWNVDSLDWKGISGMEITSRVVSRVKEGSIVLFHNNRDHILDALPSVLELLSARGYKFCSIGDLIYKDNYEIDNNGMQIPKSGG